MKQIHRISNIEDTNYIFHEEKDHQTTQSTCVLNEYEFRMFEFPADLCNSFSHMCDVQ
jgi:hypothetical protein